jgi:hypothetical protein
MSNRRISMFVGLIGLLLSPLALAWNWFGLGGLAGDVIEASKLMDSEIDGVALMNNPLYQGDKLQVGLLPKTAPLAIPDMPSGSASALLSPPAEQPVLAKQDERPSSQAEPEVALNNTPLPPSEAQTTGVEQLAALPPQTELTDDLAASRIDQFTGSNVNAYMKARDSFGKDPTKPMVYHITRNNPSDYWQGLIDLGLDRNEITPDDFMWVTDEHAKPYWLAKHHADQLFESMIIKHLTKGTKSAKVTNLLTAISIKPKSGYFFKYSKNERFNVLVNMIALGYYNAEYTKAFEQIASLLPADKIDAYESVSLTENNKTVTHSLAAWLMVNKAYIEDGYAYAVKAATHVFNHRLKHTVTVGERDLQGPFMSLASLLLRTKNISDAEHAGASIRFITVAPAEKDAQTN